MGAERDGRGVGAERDGRLPSEGPVSCGECSGCRQRRIVYLTWVSPAKPKLRLCKFCRRELFGIGVVLGRFKRTAR